MKPQKTFLIVATLAGVGLLGIYGASIWPQKASGDSVVFETKEINRSQGIGGVVESDSESKDSSTDTTDSDTSQPTHTATPQPIELNAPRQAQIKQSTPTEYHYRALRTSNDPLPQPTWVRSATKIESAWDSTTGNGVVVAVIDSGFALNHEDLQDQWFQNTAETGLTTLGDRCWTGTSANKSSNGCDDDNNGYVDDWRGWDFIGVNNSPQAGETNPYGAGVAHGTEVAGLVGATGNNGIGTATMSWNNKVMPLQALDDDGSGYTSDVAAAVYYAADNGASVINMSLGGSVDDPTLAAAVRYAHDKGVVVVAAAGNCGTGSEEGCDPTKPGAMSYPALNPYVIAVGATTSTGSRASFSSYGPGLDVVAPGSGTLVSPAWQPGNPTTTYATSLYGTSFASPIVASYVGLIKSLRPSSSVDDITALVDATATKPAGMSGAVYTPQYGHGIIDATTGLRVVSSLNQLSNQPYLLQTGNEVSEHTVTNTSRMSSGCQTTAATYCTVWARNNLGYDRFLPYAQTNASGQTGWSWTGSWLSNGDWWLRARSGSTISSTPYQLFNK